MAKKLDPKETVDVASKHSQLVNLLLEQLVSFMQIDKAGKALPPLSPKEIQKLKSLGYL